jgi:hypothetical protein
MLGCQGTLWQVCANDHWASLCSVQHGSTVGNISRLNSSYNVWNQYIFTRDILFPNFLTCWTLAFLFLLNFLRNQWNLEYITIYKMFVKAFFFLEILTFQNDLKCMISQLSSMTLTISKSSRNILFSNVAIINFIVFFDICERFTYTLYERYPPPNTSAQILHREITHYDLNLRTYHSSLF